MTALDRVLERLPDAKWRGRDYRDRCPAHLGESDNSLSIKQEDDRVLLHCHGGCEVDTVLSAIGLTIRDLYDDTRTNGRAKTKAQIVATYAYCGASERVLYETVRYRPKGFKQRRPDGRGGWVWNMDGVRRVLYRLPELLGADASVSVYVVEGEKDADRLAALGLVATCNVGGAGKWRAEYSQALRGRNVVVIPDNDGPGRAHAEQVARSLRGVAASVKVVELPGLPEHGDVSDWLANGGTPEALALLAGSAPEWQAEKLDSRFADTAYRANRENRETGRLGLTRLADLLAEPDEEVEWLVERTLPAGGVSLLGAKPKVGKSTLARNLALSAARGEAFLDRAVAKGTVVYLALEEKRSEVRRHFARMGGADEPIFIHVGSAPEEALEALEAAIREHGPVLAIVDPLLKLVRLRDANDYAEVSRALEPVIALARASGCHILLIHHLGKAERLGGDAILGSTALFGAVDTALLMKRRDGTRTIESVQRYGEDLPETVVRLDSETGRTEAAGELAALQLAEAEGAVLAALGDETMAEADIRERVGGNQTLVAKAIRSLVADGRLGRTGEGKRGDPYRYVSAVKADEGKAEAREPDPPPDDGGEGSSIARLPRLPIGGNGENRESGFVAEAGPPDVSPNGKANGYGVPPLGRCGDCGRPSRNNLTPCNWCVAGVSP